ncbi:MAG: hypothetical protein Q9186_002530 [Xanthomendoza sp. 1 TL-2023]
MSSRSNDRRRRLSLFHQPYTLPYSFMALCGSGYALANYATRLFPRLFHLIDNHFVCSPQNLRFHRYHTLLTASFMHISPVHLAVNMFSLFSIGPLVVSTLGPESFLALWVGGALGCSRAHLSYTNYLNRRLSPSYANNQNLFDRVTGRGTSPVQHSMSESTGRSVGASGSLLGMFTTLAFTQPDGKWYIFPVPVPLKTYQAAGAFAAGSAACVALGLLPGIGHVGHLGGMAVGAGYGYYDLVRRRREKGR